MDFDALERLGRLRDAGALTDEEFEIEKRRLLQGAPPQSPEPEVTYANASDERSANHTVLIAILVILLLAAAGLGAWKFLIPEKSISAATKEASSVPEVVKPLYSVASSVRGLKIAATSKLPTNPKTNGVDDYCSDKVLEPNGAGAEQVARAGWHITGSTEVGELELVSFAGSLEPGTSGLCTVQNGNVAIFKDGQLQAITYGDAVGTVRPVPNSTSARIWDASLGYQSPVADLFRDDGKLVVRPVAVADKVCDGSLVVPNVFNLPITEARQRLLSSGWKAGAVTEQNSGYPDSRIEGLRDAGVSEVDTCAGTGFAACYFDYESETADVTLTLRTLGEEDDPTVVSYDLSCTERGQ